VGLETGYPTVCATCGRAPPIGYDPGRVGHGLVDPVAERFGADTQLSGDLAHRAVALTVLLGDGLVHQPDGPLL
jgi:hypothetical protein